MQSNFWAIGICSRLYKESTLSYEFKPLGGTIWEPFPLCENYSDEDLSKNDNWTVLKERNRTKQLCQWLSSSFFILFKNIYFTKKKERESFFSLLGHVIPMQMDQNEFFTTDLLKYGWNTLGYLLESWKELEN